MKNDKLKVGVIGCGAIGSAIAKYCVNDLSNDLRLVALFDIDKDKMRSLKKVLARDVQIATSIKEIIDLSDLVIEAASIQVAAQVLEKAIKAGKDAMIMSTGGVVDREDLLISARRNNCKVYIPSGAICGLDGVKAAALEKIDRVILTTRKPPEGLKGAPYLEKKRLDLDSIKTDTLIFEGTALEAIRGFPKNINVSAALSLAGIGIKNTMVKIICSPKDDKNTHEIELKGKFGNLFIKTENIPSPDNPKTSYLAILSAMATLKGIVDSVRIGT